MSIRGANSYLISAVAALALSSGVASAESRSADSGVNVDSGANAGAGVDSRAGVDSGAAGANVDSGVDSRAGAESSAKSATKSSAESSASSATKSATDSSTESSAPFYLKASAEAFNKFGFNGRGDSPTETYGYVLGTISGVYHKAFENSQNLQIELGVAGAGMAWDSTRRASLAGEGGLGFNYIGFNPRYDGKGIASATNTKNYYVHNAHIAYEGENFHITGGRFSLDDGAYIVGLVEGVDAGVKLNSLYIKASGISSAALLGDGFFWDFTRAYTPNGLLSAQVGYDIGYLDVSAFYYYGISEYSAPGLDAKLRFASADSGFASTTRLNAVFPIYDELVMSVPVLLGGFLKNTDGKGEGFTSSILARQDFDFATKDKGAYSVGVAVYKNIGLSQARVGLFGSPLGVNVWDNSVYALGTSLNGIVYPDALSAFVFTKARYEKLGSFANALEVGLDGRYTTAPATEEYSLKLSIDWEITQNFALGVIANYYTSIFKDARTLNDFGGANIDALRANQHIDRSYVMSKISWRI
ncbi:hypothetical protein BKN38_04375 [Helicobacter sp. CLO-3]|uniref:outer membrane family protein n=1 Tax=unclassified Helicobacter TaxID=2593540 RepID=UPI000804B6C0|nr:MULTISPECIES: outer membrane family protein [unclassified Helicobacter]OBV29205.1 hypothetical protein BA723_01035 [Helicobacter sp. CLO-3]OHU84036.1 hypothetical protein BKN38_04375 [Helicobacter sp. CLO-3]